MSYVVIDETPHLGGNIDGGDSFTMNPLAWNWFVEQGYKNILDVGCAQGHALEYFRSLGCNVLGIEGLKYNVDKCQVPVIWLDLQQYTINLRGIDLVWCCEVVEHIEEQFVGNILNIITCGKMLAMSYAEPNQAGHHHVNCKPKEYWIEEVRQYGMEYDDATTQLVTKLDKTNNHFGWHGLIFRRNVC
jgi:hypothetical protein